MDRSVVTLIAAVLLLEIGSGLQGVLVPLRADMAGFPVPLVGLLGTLYYIGFVAGCVTLPRTVHRVGHIRTFSALAAVAASVLLVHAMIAAPVVWLGLRLVFGACFAGLFLVVESWLNERATPASRGNLLGLYMVATWLGLIAGKALLSMLPVAGFEPFALCAIAVALALVPLALTSGAAPSIPRIGPLAPRALMRRAPVGMIGAVGVGIANGAFWTLGPIFAVERTGSAAGVSLFMSACVLGGALSQWPLGRLSDRIDRRWMVVATSLAAAGAGLALAMAPEGGAVWRPFLLAGLFGASALPLYALCAAHANDRAEPSEFVQVSSLLLLAFGAGAILGPLAAGVLIGAAGPVGLFFFTAAIHLGLGLFALLRIVTVAQVPEDERAVFSPQAPVSHGTQAAIELMPPPPGPDEPHDRQAPPGR